ncbi:hypothetical protein JOE63_003067 [Cellulosimicrobium cellulans]|uniref:hypothetical protein n=1 Tax=Cellulosimicrobium cellulans TaxID=1710 RepID=UPI001957FD1A|nr:hypothetical protein [Cellulosimicrobium cellulans]MBM7820590.1 hypothetical protein [Cellulosimicrobium cellulans]
MGRAPGRTVARGAGWGAVVPCAVVVVLAVLASLSGRVPVGEVLAYAVVLAIVSVPVCAFAGAAIGGLVVFVRARVRPDRRTSTVAVEVRATGTRRAADARVLPVPTTLTADDVLAVPGISSVEVTTVEPGREDLYVRFDHDPDGERDVIVLHNTVLGSALVLVGTARLEVDYGDLRQLLDSVAQHRYRVERGNRVVVWQATGDERVFV